MYRTLATTLFLVAATSGGAMAQDDAGLLHFDWLSDEQTQRVAEAHTALSNAQTQICDVAVDIYAEHVSQMGGADIPDEQTAFFKRRCEAEGFADHMERSIDLHDAIHGLAGGH